MLVAREKHRQGGEAAIEMQVQQRQPLRLGDLMNAGFATERNAAPSRTNRPQHAGSS